MNLNKVNQAIRDAQNAVVQVRFINEGFDKDVLREIHETLTITQVALMDANRDIIRGVNDQDLINTINGLYLDNIKSLYASSQIGFLFEKSRSPDRIVLEMAALIATVIANLSILVSIMKENKK